MASDLYVLVVDDEELICWVLKQKLAEKGFRVDTAGSIDDVLELCENHRYSHLITDLKLVDCDGFDVINVVKKTNPKIKSIMISAHGSAENRERARQAGVGLFQSKPIEFSNTLNYLIHSG